MHLIDGAIVWQDTRTLDQAKAARIAAMRDARDAAIEAGFEWDGSPFDADQVAQSRMLGAAFAATGPGFDPVAWRLADNTWRELSAGDVIAVYAALQTHLRAAFARFAALEAEIKAVEAGPAALAAVDAIEWDEPE